MYLIFLGFRMTCFGSNASFGNCILKKLGFFIVAFSCHSLCSKQWVVLLESIFLSSSQVCVVSWVLGAYMHACCIDINEYGWWLVCIQSPELLSAVFLIHSLLCFPRWDCEFSLDFSYECSTASQPTLWILLSLFPGRCSLRLQRNYRTFLAFFIS